MNINSTQTIGVLALQGDFEKHLQSVRACGAIGMPVRDADLLDHIAGLIIPGGESTTVGRLMDRYGLTEPIRRHIEAGLPVYGTCTGAILLAKEIIGSDQTRIGLMDIAIERNAYGRQIDSFEADIAIPTIGDPPFRAVFIRAPIIRRCGKDVEVLALCEGNAVLAREKNILVSTFHPELTDDLRIHRYFLQVVASRSQ
jgi:5'-phosphate synthase pdxT subunit